MDLKVIPEEISMIDYGYIVNQTKSQYISKSRVEKYTSLNALPILQSVGNGRGVVGSEVGDYRQDHTLVGYWSGDVVRLQRRKPEGYVEIIFDLV